MSSTLEALVEVVALKDARGRQVGRATLLGVDGSLYVGHVTDSGRLRVAQARQENKGELRLVTFPDGKSAICEPAVDDDGFGYMKPLREVASEVPFELQIQVPDAYSSFVLSARSSR